MTGLRVIDAGDAGALRSQALWHGIASAMTESSRPTLSFCHPTETYIGLGYHRSLDELDCDHCQRQGLPIVRRRIGGGPVYIDDQQLFFQLTLPAAAAPARVDLLYRRFLQPAVTAFRTIGLAAELRGTNDIAVEDRKISGTGAGRIGDGVTVVGNVIFRFPHHRMVEALAMPSNRLANECLRLMRRHVSSLAKEGVGSTTLEEARHVLTRCYAQALDLEPHPSELTTAEQVEVERWSQRFADPDWLTDPPIPKAGGRRIKISADAWLWSTSTMDLELEVSIACGRIAWLHLESPNLNGAGSQMSEELVGLAADPAQVSDRLRRFGTRGLHVARLLEPGLRQQ